MHVDMKLVPCARGQGPGMVPCARGHEIGPEKDFSATLTLEDLTVNPKPIPTSPELRDGREEPLSLDETKLRQC